jgi:hypothetical protein
VPAADDQLPFLEREVAYWRARAEAAEDRIRQAAGFYPDAPPEPPVGTAYLAGDVVVWQRTGSGWYCLRAGCRNCPAEWAEVWDRDLSRGGYTQRLPSSSDRDGVSPERDRHP